MGPGVTQGMRAGGGPMAPCPHCRSQAAAEANGSLRWVCAVCGGPLVPTAAGDIPRSGAELADLVAAQRARGMAMGWGAAAVVLAATALMATGVGLLVWHVSHAAGGVVVALGVASALLTALCASRARRAGAQRAARLEVAWESVAAEVLRARGGAVTATELARAMATQEAHAESLLARLSAGGRARVAVTELSDLSYQSVERATEPGEAGDEAERAEAERRAREP
jgi:type IV secretory pathway TrbD component